MDLERFENYANKYRKNLENLLFGKEPMHKRIKDYFFDLHCEKSDDFSFGIELRVCKIPLKIEIPPYTASKALAFFSRISSSIKYACFHEIGETAYLLPLTLAYNYDRSPNKNRKTEIVASEITMSDIFGDLFASTFSPLTPKQQLELLDGKDPVKFKNLRFSEYMFTNMQLLVFEAYETRNDGKYHYGPELKGFYREILNLQLGFSETERKNFQLKLYDTTQKQIGNRMKKVDRLTKDNIAEIIFNKDTLISELKIK